MKKQPNNWLVFSGLAFQVAAVMYLAAYAGKKLDIYLAGDKAYGTLGVSTLGLVVILYLIYAQTKHLR
jgi:cell shape-determining protein MreD